VSHRVALCGEFPTEVGKTPTDRLSSPVSGVFRTEKDREVYAGLRSFDKVEREAGEKDGVADAPRPVSQRTAMPTAQGLLALPPRKSHRGCKTARNPVVGVVTSEKRRNHKETAWRCERRCTNKKEMIPMFENKKKFALWVYPDTLEKIENIYREDDCESKSEFIEKAINFYIGYLTTEDKKNYLPSIVTSTLKAIVDSSDTRQNRMMFKLAVEIAIVQNLIAATQDIDPVSLERLRGECVKEVKRLNGGFSFEDALAWQKG
jgi:hypothetical protein